MASGGFRPEAILTQAKNNNPQGIRALVEAGLPVQYCNQARARPAIALPASCMAAALPHVHTPQLRAHHAVLLPACCPCRSARLPSMWLPCGERLLSYCCCHPDRVLGIAANPWDLPYCCALWSSCNSRAHGRGAAQHPLGFSGLLRIYQRGCASTLAGLTWFACLSACLCAGAQWRLHASCWTWVLM